MSDTNPADDELMRLAMGDDGAADDGGNDQDVAAVDDQADDDAQGSEGADDQDQDEPGKDGKAPSKRWKARVDTLTARNHDLERRLADAERKLSGAPEPTTDDPPEKPDPAKFEFGAADPDYIDALTDWKIETREHQKAAQSQASEAHAAVSERINAGAAKAQADGEAKYEDFEAKIAEAVEARGGEPLPPMLGVALSVSPVGGDLVYRLATDEAASARLERLAKSKDGGQAFAMALGELEGEYVDGDDDADLDLSDSLDMARMLGRMRARVKGGRVTTPVKKVVPTNAPVPPAQRARGGTGRFEVSDDTEDFAAFEQKYSPERARR